MRYISLTIIAILLIIGFFYGLQFLPQNHVTATVQTATTQLQAIITQTSPQQKVRVLIVPGHEPDNGGTNYGNLYERNLVVTIGQDLQGFLTANSHYQSFITRDTQAWNPTFASYFQNNWNQIILWEQTAKSTFTQSSAALQQSASQEIHNDAATDDALRLYGMVKWSNENNIDLMIHLHLNNYPDAMAKQIVGKYSGLVMYEPAAQLKNSSSSKPIAAAIFHRLSLYTPISNLPVESGGLEDDSELIAMGAYNTSNAASLLIEYDYIYEPQFVNPDVRPIALNDAAYQTYLGLEDYYNNAQNVTATSSYNPVLIYDWKTPVAGKTSNAKDIYAMQTALLMDGAYPPAGKTLHDCPHSGTLGTCTENAVKAFQKEQGIIGENIDGAKTFTALQKIYRSNN